MDGQPAPVARPADPVGRALFALCRLFAAVGCIAMVIMTVISVVSIAGRALFSAPVPGDYEMVQILAAVSVFAFLPYCQIRGQNVVVDFFTVNASRRVRGLLDALGSAVYLAIAVIIAWRLVEGGFDKWDYGEETMVIRFPLWVGFVPAVASMALLSAVCLWTTWRHLEDARP
jgi:TRAP-type C4-dicarboxylate transport system permease small subunit